MKTLTWGEIKAIAARRGITDGTPVILDVDDSYWDSVALIDFQRGIMFIRNTTSSTPVDDGLVKDILANKHKQ